MANKEAFIAGVCDKIDERLLEDRVTVEGNAVSIFLQDLTNYNDINYKPEDFLTKDGRFLFCVGKSLRDLGYNYLDEVTIMSKCSQEIKDRISALGGYKMIQHLLDVVNAENADAILDDLTKSNILIKLYKSGFNLFDEVTLDNGKRISPFKLFKNFTSTEVLDWYDAKISGLSKVNNNQIIYDEYVDFGEKFISDLQNNVDSGVSFADAGEDINGDKISVAPFLSSNILGLAPGTLSLFGGFSGVGKTTYMVGVIMALISQGKKVLVLENEIMKNKLYLMIFSWFISRYMGYQKLPKKKLESGVYTDEEKKIIIEAEKQWKEKFADKLRVVGLSSANSKLSSQIIKNSVLRSGFDVFIVDTFKLDDSADINGALWQVMKNNISELEGLTKKYGVIGIATVQLTNSDLKRLWLDSSCLGTSKGIKEVCSNLILLRKLGGDLELINGSDIYCRPFRSKKNEQGDWIEEPYDADPSKVWRVLFIDKSRSGPDSGDTGVAYLLRYDGDHCSFYETAKCRPVRKIING